MPGFYLSVPFFLYFARNMETFNFSGIFEVLTKSGKSLENKIEIETSRFASLLGMH